MKRLSDIGKYQELADKWGEKCDYHRKGEKTERAEAGERNKWWEWWVSLITLQYYAGASPTGSPRLIVVFFGILCLVISC